jgi:hypothetical protein
LKIISRLFNTTVLPKTTEHGQGKPVLLKIISRPFNTTDLPKTTEHEQGKPVQSVISYRIQ